MSKISLENWECARGEKSRHRRGPKPVVAGQLLKSTAWLDGELCWPEGALGWRIGGSIVVPDDAQIERAGRALDKLEAQGVQRQTVAARRDKWRLARKLGALQARDLDKLCAVSRRRNPAALQRLAPLLVLESLDVELPNSPARALLGAWPHSQIALESIIADEGWPAPAHSLAAFVIGAAAPAQIARLPKLWRGVAVLGARFCDELPDFVAPRLLHDAALQGDEMAWRIVQIARSSALFAPDAGALSRLVKAHGIERALAIGEQLIALELVWPELPAFVASGTPNEAALARETELTWRRARRAWQGEVRQILSRLALQSPDAIAPFLRLDALLRALPLQVLAHREEGQQKRKFLAPESVEAALFVATVTAQLPAWLARLARQALQTPDVAQSFELWGEVVADCAEKAPEISRQKGKLRQSSRGWLEVFGNRVARQIEPLFRLTLLAGADFARLAWKRGHHHGLACRWARLSGARRPAPAVIASWVQLVRELPISDVSLWDWNHLHRHIGPEAGALIAAAISATRLAPPVACAHMIEGLLWTPPSQAEGRASWKHLPAMVRACAADLSECDPEHIARASDAVVELAGVCHRLNVNSEQRPALARAYAEVYRAHLAATKVGEQPDCACEIALRLCYQSSPATTLIADFAATLRAALDALFADRKSSKNIWPGFEVIPHRPQLARALRYGLEIAPARTLNALEHLGALKKSHQLDALQTLENSAPELAESWHEIARISPAIAETARDCAGWQILAGEANGPPAGAQKILDWPRKWVREIEALQTRVAENPQLSERLANLRARLADEARWRAQQADELGELLENARKRAAFAALERAIEGAFRARLQTLCGALPAEFAFDDDWFNALLLGSDVEHNRKWARALLRHEIAGKPDWRQQLPGNARFLEQLSKRGVDIAFYLSEFGRARGELWLWIENEPLGILQMGNRFNTCLSRGGCNSFSGVANAIELNKRVVYARDKKGHIVARQLWAISAEFKLIGFDVYSTYSDEERAGLDAHFTAHARQWARGCGLELADAGAVENLVAPRWYDDGARAWESAGETSEVAAKNRIASARL